MLKATHGILKPSTVTPAFDLALVGTMKFTGLSTSNISYAQDSNMYPQTGAFCIEWFQYQTDSNAYPRCWAIGNYPSTFMGVSIEGGQFYFWINGGANSFGSAMASSAYKNKWVHFAITRDASSNIKVWKDGTQLGSTVVNSYNFNNTANNLVIGNESTPSADASFGGWMTNFRWVKGDPVYTTAFTRPSTPLSNISGSRLLLLATSSGTLTTDTATGRTGTFSNVTWQAFAQTMV
jgi:hypothetical protein